MTDTSKYRNVSLSKETYSVLETLSKLLLPGSKLSISKTIEALANTELTNTEKDKDNIVKKN